MGQLVINNVTGITLPYEIYVCNVYGNGCILVATVNTAIPPSATIVLPPAFDMAPAIGVKIIDGVGCEKFMILNCVDLPPKGKQFQDGDYFYFMNYDIYQFQ
jgi:hypothetical protein